MGLCNSKESGGPRRGKPNIYLASVADGHGPLTAAEYKQRLQTSGGVQRLSLPSSAFSIEYAYVTQRGYYPDSPNKPSQDSLCVHTYFNGDPDQLFLGVFDGHGEFGTSCSQFAKDKVPENLINNTHFLNDPESALRHAMTLTNNQLHVSEVDDTMSGTTAITALIRGRDVYVANVGDSRAVLAARDASGRLVARDLSVDQTPFRADECARVRAAGARVLTLEQLEGLKDASADCWTAEELDGGDPPRLWFPNAMLPGTAFTRSIGDATAERIGVTAEPETLRHALGPHDALLILASDGVFEFMSSQAVVDMLASFDDLHEAAASVVAEANRLWLATESRSDDITLVVAGLSGIETRAGAGGGTRRPAGSSPGLASMVTQGGGAGGLVRVDTMGRFHDADATPFKRASPWIPGRESGGLPSPGFTGRDIEADGDDAATEHDVTSVGAVAPADAAMLDETLRSNFLFCHLSDGEKRLLYGQMERLEVAPGDAVITQGEQGDAFFVVERGEFDVYVSKGGAGASPSLAHTYVSRPDHHPTFGELALLYGKPRAATVRARTAGALWQLSRAAYKGVLRKKPPQSVSRKLRKVEALAPLRMSQLQRLSAALSPRYFDDGAVIVRQGEAADVFFFITAGEAMCAVRKNAGDDAESAKDALCLSAGQWFGEKALAGPGATRAATVTARGQVKLLAISRATFEELFGPLATITAAKRRWQESCAAQREALRGILGAAALAPPDSLSDLQPVATLFTSETTTVRLYEHKFVGSSFTVRLTSVAEATARGKQAAVLGARAISRSLAPCMYVPHVVAAFKTPNALSELLPSSPLCTLEHLVAGGGAGCVEPEVARFLAAGLVSALDHLHFSGLIYRGLSAHTVLLTDGGVVQLVDMRFAKRSEGKTFTMCGAREYLAPEMLDSAGHTEAVDWWALGALLFYMLTGRTPFAEPGGGGNELALFKRVLAPDAAPSFPPDFPPDARELVTALLTRDPARRLGNTAGGAAAIRGHAYFAGTDWDGLERRLAFEVPPALLARLASFRLPRLTKFDLARPTGDTSWTRDF